MEYLTVHDLVWINNTVTGKVNGYDYVTLEAAMAGQYCYGQSQEVFGPAAKLLERLLSKSPFESGTRRSAFIAVITFLNANGYATCVEDKEAAALVKEVATGQRTALEAMTTLASVAKAPLPDGLSLRKLIAHECNLHLEALKLLAEGD